MKATIIITAFNEPNIGKVIEAAQQQKTDYEYDILVSAPDDATLGVAIQHGLKDPRISIFQDEGKGKSKALNEIFKIVKNDILIFTDGDVKINRYTVQNIMDTFKDGEVGCVAGRPVPLDNRKDKYGYWAHFLFDAAHELRTKLNERKQFIECSGYLIAFRNGVIKEIPLDVADDSIIPYLFAESGYRIAYCPQAQVFVKNPTNFKDWMKQKVRTAKAHTNLGEYVNIEKIRKVKSFGTEAKGIKKMFTYPKTPKEFWWTHQLVLARLWMWIMVIYENTFKGGYSDNWERIESAR